MYPAALLSTDYNQICILYGDKVLSSISIELAFPSPRNWRPKVLLNVVQFQGEKLTLNDA